MTPISRGTRRNLLILLLIGLVILAGVASTVGLKHYGAQATREEAAYRESEISRILAEFDQTLESCIVEFSSPQAKHALATYLEKPYIERDPSECSVGGYSSPGVRCQVGLGKNIYSRFDFDDEAESRLPLTPHVAAFRAVTATCVQQRGLALAPAFDVCDYLNASSGGETASQCFGIKRNIENGQSTPVALVARERLIRGHLGKGAMAADPEYAGIVRGLKESDARIEQSIAAHQAAIGATKEGSGAGWTLK